MLAFSLIACSNESLNKDEIDSDDTLSDKIAEEKGILSPDDAEVLVYNQLSDDEQQRYKIDYLKKEGTRYFIRVYEKTNGQIKVKKKYAVDFNTEEIQQLQ